jgi:dTDP-4-dehydrorhamnose 3,5-epimerase
VKIESLSIDGAWVCTPVVHGDDRGRFLEWLRIDLISQAIGRSFDVVQANHSVSARGVVRGIHFADVPPGQAKLIYCTGGAILDVVVDVRVGSPTFGVAECLELDAAAPRVVVLAEGLGHAFRAFTDDASVTYLVSSLYNPTTEHTVSPFDPAVAIPWGVDADNAEVSARDAAAPSLEAAAAAGILPSYERCLERYADQRV